MRFLCAALGAAFLPMLASAEGMQEGPDWRTCRQDVHCVVIQGTCEKTAVNLVYQAVATDYYKDLATRAKCVEKFWVPKGEVIAQCKPMATVEGQEPMGSCIVVARPHEKSHRSDQWKLSK